MDKRIEFLKNSGFDYEKFKLDNEYSAANLLIAMQKHAEWMAEQAFIAGYEWNDACYIYLHENQNEKPIDYEKWLKKFKKEQ